MPPAAAEQAPHTTLGPGKGRQNENAGAEKLPFLRGTGFSALMTKEPWVLGLSRIL